VALNNQSDASERPMSHILRKVSFVFSPFSDRHWRRPYNSFSFSVPLTMDASSAIHAYRQRDTCCSTLNALAENYSYISSITSLFHSNTPVCEINFFRRGIPKKRFSKAVPIRFDLSNTTLAL